MFNVPILFIVFKRLNTTQKVFSQVQKIQPKQLFIAADGPRETIPDEAEKCKAVRKWILDNIDWDCDIKTRFLDKNVGCKYGPYSAIKWFFSSVDYGIILEDDCYPDLSFFPYCEDLLKKYKDNPRIRMISGRNNVTKYQANKQSYYFTTGAGIWGWATWKREIESFDVDRSFPDETVLYNQLLKFTRDENESQLLVKQAHLALDNDYTAWDFQWGINGKLNEQLAVTPAVNLIKNIGFDVDGTHIAEKRDDFAKLKTMSFPLKHPNKIEVSYELSKKIADFMILPPSLYSKIKSGIKKLVKATLPSGAVRLIQKWKVDK